MCAMVLMFDGNLKAPSSSGVLLLIGPSGTFSTP